MFAARISYLRVRNGHAYGRVTYAELFFDLVFVFAITQLSHGLLERLTLLGAVQTAILMFAVWWAWIDTAWMTNWLDPERAPVRMLLFALMLVGLVISASIPGAFGERGLAFASGLAATTAVFSLLKPGDEVAAAADLYGGTFRLLDKVFKPWGLNARYTDDPTPAGFAKIITPATRMVWIETPTNPLLQIIDIAAVAKLAHEAGAPLAVDNTFASPYLQQPIRLGADLVVHSTTKYVGGHSDVVGGAVIGSRELVDKIAFFQNAAGGVPGPFDSWLTLRGIKTLAVRMERHCANARRLAAWLVEQPQLQRVLYPGLPRHPGHDLAKRQMRDFGGMISISLKGGKDAALKMLSKIKIFSLAESLGGVESLIGHPATMTHASIPAEVRHARGLDDGLLRLSVGIEDVEDLQQDLAQALA